MQVKISRSLIIDSTLKAIRIRFPFDNRSVWVPRARVRDGEPHYILVDFGRGEVRIYQSKSKDYREVGASIIAGFFSKYGDYAPLGEKSEEEPFAYDHVPERKEPIHIEADDSLKR